MHYRLKLDIDDIYPQITMTFYLAILYHNLLHSILVNSNNK